MLLKRSSAPSPAAVPFILRGGAGMAAANAAVVFAAHGDRVNAALSVLLSPGRDLFKAWEQLIDPASASSRSPQSHRGEYRIVLSADRRTTTSWL